MLPESRCTHRSYAERPRFVWSDRGEGGKLAPGRPRVQVSSSDDITTTHGDLRLRCEARAFPMMFSPIHFGCTSALSIRNAANPTTVASAGKLLSTLPACSIFCRTRAL